MHNDPVESANHSNGEVLCLDRTLSRSALHTSHQMQSADPVSYTYKRNTSWVESKAISFLESTSCSAGEERYLEFTNSSSN